MSIQNFCLYCGLEKNRPSGCNLCGPTAQGLSIDEHPSYLPPETVLNGQYIVGRVLGHGGFGITYLGIDANLNIRVAIKEFMPRDLAARHAGTHAVIPYTHTKNHFQQQIDKFLQEARSLARFQHHPNIISVQNFFRENGTGYLVMEYLEGETLHDICTKQNTPIPESIAVPWILESCQGLQSLHDIGMLHRDIKPQNIYLTSQQRIKLLDFGAARQTSSQHQLTQMWTPGFAPPEQCDRSDEQQGPWTDIYAVGATLYTLLTNQAPPDAITRLQYPRNPLPFPQNLSISPHVMEAIQQATALSLAERFRSLNAFVAKLQDTPLAEASSPQQSALPPFRENAQQTHLPGVYSREFLINSNFSSPSIASLPPSHSTRKPSGARKFLFFSFFFVWLPLIGYGGYKIWKTDPSSFIRKEVPLASSNSQNWITLPSPRPTQPQVSTKQNHSTGTSPIEPSYPRPVPLQPAPSTPQQPVPPVVQTFRWIRELKQAFKQNENTKALQLAQRLRSEIPLPVPLWQILAWEVIARAKAGQKDEPLKLIKQAEETYKQWKKSLRQQKIQFYYYLRKPAHLVMGEAYWQTSKNFSGAEKAYLLGQIWTDWILSSRSAAAEKLWWDHFSQNKTHPGLSQTQLLQAAEQYFAPDVNQYSKGLELYQYLYDRTDGFEKCEIFADLLWAYYKRKQWSQIIDHHPQIHSSCSKKMSKKKKRELIARSLRYFIVATFHQHGLQQAYKQLENFSRKDIHEKINTITAIASHLVEQKRIKSAIRVYEKTLPLTQKQSKYIQINKTLLNLGYALYTAGRYRNAYFTFEKIKKMLHPIRDYRGIVTVTYWSAMAAKNMDEKDEAEKQHRDLCLNYPLHILGMKSCKAIGKSLSDIEAPSTLMDWNPSGEDRTRWQQLVEYQEHDGVALELMRQLSSQQDPPLGLVEQTAKAYARVEDWFTSFTILYAHRLRDMYQNRLPKPLWNVAFPRPSKLWSLLKRISQSHQRDPLLIAAIVRRESHFLPEHQEYYRSGLMGLHPSWSSSITFDPEQNLQQGIQRLKILQDQFSSPILGVMAYRGTQPQLREIMQSYDNLSENSAAVLGCIHPGIRSPASYVFDQHDGILWYYYIYQWLYPSSPAP